MMSASPPGGVSSPHTEGALPTLTDVLAMPATQLGRPQVVAGHKHLDRLVRWLHVSELSEIQQVLRGGELVLTTGIALADSPEAWESYVAKLVDAGASGVMLELGERFVETPSFLVKSCARQGIPLIVLHRRIEFVRLTEAVHTRILERQMASLRLSDRAQEVFSSLTVGGASVDEILSATARLANSAVVFEDLIRHVQAFDAAGRPVDELLDRWRLRSSAAVTDKRTAICGPEEWVTTIVEVDGEAVGRLILLPQEHPNADHLMIIERASTALTLNRMLSRDKEITVKAQKSILADLIERRYGNDSDVYARAEASGIRLRHQMLVGLLVRDTDGTGGDALRPSNILRIVTEAARSARVPVLLTQWAEDTAAALVVVPDGSLRSATLTKLSHEIRTRYARAHLSAGSTVTRLIDVRRSVLEAAQVDRATRNSADTADCFELPDLGIRGLLFTLSGDRRLQAFIARTLDPILDYDARHGTDMLRVLSVYLSGRGNKSEAARAAAMSRASFYERLDTISRLLGADLTSSDVCTSLHAAVLALEAERAAAEK